jgi:hypothetical protein
MARKTAWQTAQELGLTGRGRTQSRDWSTVLMAEWPHRDPVTGQDVVRVAYHEFGCDYVAANPSRVKFVRVPRSLAVSSGHPHCETCKHLDRSSEDDRVNRPDW